MSKEPQAPSYSEFEHLKAINNTSKRGEQKKINFWIIFHQNQQTFSIKAFVVDSIVLLFHSQGKVNKKGNWFNVICWTVDSGKIPATWQVQYFA